MNSLEQKLFYRLSLKSIRKGITYFDELPDLGLEIYLTAEEVADDFNFELLKKTLKNKAVNLHAPFYDLNIASQDRFIRKHSQSLYQKIFQWGCRLQAQKVVFHLNYNETYYREHQDKWLENCAAFYQKLLTKSRGTMIAIENTGESLPQLFLKLQNLVNHNFFSFCLDLGHLNIFARNHLSEWLDAINNQPAIHLHIHDNNGEKDQHLPVGLGNFNWFLFLEKISKNSTDLSGTFENLSLQDILISKNNFLNFWRLSCG